MMKKGEKQDLAEKSLVQDASLRYTVTVVSPAPGAPFLFLCADLQARSCSAAAQMIS